MQPLQATSRSPIKPPILSDSTISPVIVSEGAASNLKPGELFLSSRDANHLSKILGTNILSVEELFKHCERLTTIKVGGVNLTLEPGLIERLYSRAAGRDFTEFLNETVKSLLCGMCGY